MRYSPAPETAPKWLCLVVVVVDPASSSPACPQVLKWVEEAIQASKVHLLSTDHEDGGEHMWPVPFDPSLKEVTISLSGPAPGIEVRDPAGRSPGEGNRQGVMLCLTESPHVWTIGRLQAWGSLNPELKA